MLSNPPRLRELPRYIMTSSFGAWIYNVTLSGLPLLEGIVFAYATGMPTAAAAAGRQAGSSKTAYSLIA